MQSAGKIGLVAISVLAVLALGVLALGGYATHHFGENQGRGGVPTGNEQVHGFAQHAKYTVYWLGDTTVSPSTAISESDKHAVIVRQIVTLHDGSYHAVRVVTLGRSGARPSEFFPMPNSVLLVKRAYPSGEAAFVIADHRASSSNIAGLKALAKQQLQPVTSDPT